MQGNTDQNNLEYGYFSRSVRGHVYLQNLSNANFIQNKFQFQFILVGNLIWISENIYFYNIDIIYFAVIKSKCFSVKTFRQEYLNQI